MNLRSIGTIALCLAAASGLVSAAGCERAPRKGEDMAEQKQNRLGAEKSPYLLQHANNPVDWYPWGEEAFAAARAQDKPIFLSIGYSTCHWCHVMEHESFENDSIAAIMNELFINIKVDREERPDVDHVYMRAVQAMNQGGGGWPLSVFLTPDLKPFFGGTYFPPEQRFGRPGFPQVLRRLAEVYRTQREEIDRVTTDLLEFLQAGPDPGSEIPEEALLGRAFGEALAAFDRQWGGFGGAPKFPRSMSLSLLMRHYARHGDDRAQEMVTVTLDKMAAGGMYDHVGGGFHRYSVDAQWHVPHFEKMLYDNALLARTYLEAFQQQGHERYAAVARDIFRYLLRDMRTPDGAFYSAEDADSEGEEGKFYVWSRSEIDAVLGKESAAFCDYYDVTTGGNFEGDNILWTPRPLDAIARAHDVSPGNFTAQLERHRARLLEVRSERVRPHRDEKVLTAWNGLLLGTFALGHQVLGDTAYLEAAREIAEFLLTRMWNGETLSARWAGGEVRYDGFLDDYAFTAWGLLDLWEAGFEPRYLKAAFELLDAADEKFRAPEGGYYFAPASHTELLSRSQEVFDGAVPSGNSIMVMCLLKRAQYTGEMKHRERALEVLRAYRDYLDGSPFGSPQMLCALDFVYGAPREVVIAGSPRDAAGLLAALRADFLPNKVVLLKAPGSDEVERLAPITRGKSAPEGQALAYVCRDFTCELPTPDPEAMLAQMR